MPPYIHSTTTTITTKKHTISTTQVKFNFPSSYNSRPQFQYRVFFFVEIDIFYMCVYERLFFFLLFFHSILHNLLLFLCYIFSPLQITINTLSILFCFVKFCFWLDLCEIFFVRVGCVHSNPIFIYVAENSIIFFFFLYCTTRTQFFDSRLSTLTRFAHCSLCVCIYVLFVFFPLGLLTHSLTFIETSYVCTHTHRPIVLLYVSLCLYECTYQQCNGVLSINYTCLQWSISLMLQIKFICECVREQINTHIYVHVRTRIHVDCSVDRLRIQFHQIWPSE